MKKDQDLTGDLRPFNKVANVTAYEFLGRRGMLCLTPTDNILYVNKSVSGGNSLGSSWANAVTELADALRWAYENRDRGLWSSDRPLQIWVADGIYKPLYSLGYRKAFVANPVEPRDRAFLMVKNVQLFGGFPASGMPGMGERILKPQGGSATVLSGDYNDDDSSIGKGRCLRLTNRTDNAFHIILSAGDIGENCVVDGFTIKGGGSENDGKFIRVNSESFSRAYGGGICNILTAGCITFRNLEIIDNMACSSSSYAYGGGIYNEIKEEGTVRWINNTLRNNIVSSSASAAAAFGGGVYNRNSKDGVMMWEGNTIENNIATSGSLAYGGGMYNENDGLMVCRENTIGCNTATSATLSYGGGIFNHNAGAMAWHDNKINGNKVAPFGSSFNGDGVYNRNSESGTMLWTNDGEVIFKGE